MIGNTQFYSTQDSDSAYWSIPINENDRKKTAFITLMPFGICNAPSTYQCLIDQALKEVPPRYLIYTTR